QTVQGFLRSTIGTFDPTSGNWFLRNSNSAGPFDFGFVFGLPGWRPAVGDWDGNGTQTIGVVDPTTATWFLRNENSPGLPDVAGPPSPSGIPGCLPLPAHWAGGPADATAASAPAPSPFHTRNTAGPGADDITLVFGVGGRGFVPLAGDWTGSGRTSVGL